MSTSSMASARAHDRVGDRLLLLDTRDLLDDVVHRLEVLDVDGGDHVDPGVEQLVDVLPALLVAGARDVGVRELVDEDAFRLPGEHGVDVHLFEGRAAVLHLPARHDLEVADLRGGVRAIVRLDEPDHDVGTAFVRSLTFVEHREGLPDAGRSTQVDAKVATRHVEELTSSTRRACWRGRSLTSPLSAGLEAEAADRLDQQLAWVPRRRGTRDSRRRRARRRRVFSMRHDHDTASVARVGARGCPRGRCSRELGRDLAWRSLRLGFVPRDS